jgi:tRNA threonylcarbamoyladenosine biosynthesis protein TsaB
MIIAIETATEVCSAALVHSSNVLAWRSVHEKNIHSERLLILIDEVMNDSKMTLSQLTAVAVSIGPGSFTGLRIGLSAAKGLAMSLKIPLIAVPTLDGIAESYRLNSPSAAGTGFCAMIEAKREEAFFSFYRITDDINRTTDYAIKGRSEILDDAAAKSAVTSQPVLSAASVGILAERKRKELLISDYTLLEPLYLRDFVATLPKKIV